MPLLWWYVTKWRLQPDWYDQRGPDRDNLPDVSQFHARIVHIGSDLRTKNLKLDPQAWNGIYPDNHFSCVYVPKTPHVNTKKPAATTPPSMMTTYRMGSNTAEGTAAIKRMPLNFLEDDESKFHFTLSTHQQIEISTNEFFNSMQQKVAVQKLTPIIRQTLNTPCSQHLQSTDVTSSTSSLLGV